MSNDTDRISWLFIFGVRKKKIYLALEMFPFCLTHYIPVKEKRRNVAFIWFFKLLPHFDPKNILKPSKKVVRIIDQFAVKCRSKSVNLDRLTEYQSHECLHLPQLIGWNFHLFNRNNWFEFTNEDNYRSKLLNREKLQLNFDFLYDCFYVHRVESYLSIYLTAAKYVDVLLVIRGIKWNKTIRIEGLYGCFEKCNNCEQYQSQLKSNK